MKHTGFKVVVIILLVAILAMEGGRLYIRWQEWQDREAQAKLVKDFNAATNTAITGLLDSYQKDAYQSSADRITEQQLIATEYSMQALQILMRQNQLLLQLLATK